MLEKHYGLGAVNAEVDSRVILFWMIMHASE